MARNTTKAPVPTGLALPGGLEIAVVPLEQIKPHPRNPRAIDDESLAGLAQSVSRFGLVEPIVVNRRTMRIVGGHQRAKVLRSSGATEAAVMLGEWSDEDEIQLLLSLNNEAISGHWTADLTNLLRSLKATPTFEPLRLDALLKNIRSAEPANPEGAEDDYVPDPPKKPTTVVGGGWQLGRHVLVCGDSTDLAVAQRALSGELAKICWTDPPWNVAIGTHHAYGDKNRYRPIANDDLGDKFPAFAAAFAAAFSASLLPGGMCYVAMSTQEWPVIDAAMRGAGMHWSATIIWAKDALILSQRDYHTKYEPIWYGWKEGAPRLYPLADRKQSDVWEIPRPKRSEEHPTMKPVELVARALQNSSAPDDLVFEPFGGSGTTLIAAEQLGRRCGAIELSPAYCDVIVDRWQTMTGGKAKRLTQ